MRFENRLVLSAMAGINNAEFCNRQRAALVILGGFNADRGANEAAKRAITRGRREFVFDDPLEGIEEEVAKVKKRFAVNIRSSSVEGYVAAAEIADKYGGIVEINAHCRQPEFVAARCGEWLLFNPRRLIEVVRRVSKIALTFVKVRGSHPIDYEELCRSLFDAGASAIHIDAMIPGGGCDIGLISKVSRLGFVIGNNSFVDASSGERIIRAGAKMVSAARAVLKNPRFFEGVLSNSELLSQPVEL